MNEYIKGLLGLGGGMGYTEGHFNYSSAVITHKFSRKVVWGCVFTAVL